MGTLTRILIGIDDTDNKDSRGTGFHSRQLGRLIESNHLGFVDGISRHQLFFDPRIPYTSQNSSACLDVRSDNIEGLIQLSRAFLLKESAIGSDAGLAVCTYNATVKEIEDWGRRAKKEVLTQKEAIEIASRNNIYLEGLTGDKDGIIGSLAAIGLRKSGDDGRFIWLRGKEIRELKGNYTCEELITETSVDSIRDKIGNEISPLDSIDVGTWVRPAIKEHKIIIYVDKTLNNEKSEWAVASKEFIKSISD